MVYWSRTSPSDNFGGWGSLVAVGAVALLGTPWENKKAHGISVGLDI